MPTNFLRAAVDPLAPATALAVGEEKFDILLVDDNSRNVLALAAILESLGQNLVRAESGMQALRCCLEQDFALVLLDIQMPGLDGFETAAIIRERDRSRQTPIIFLTAFRGDDEQIAKAYALGAVDFLSKPIIPFILHAKVRAFVDLHRKTEEIKRQALLLRDSDHERTLAEAAQRWEARLLREEMLKERTAAATLTRISADRERAEAALQISHRRLSVLSEVAIRLLVDDQPSEFLDSLVRLVSEHLGLEVYLAHLARDDGKTLVLEVAAGIEPASAKDGCTAATEATAHLVAASMQRTIAEHVQLSSDASLALVRSAGLEAYACFPLVAQGRLLGTLAFGTRRRPTFEADDISVMQTVCDQIAISLERVRLIAELSLRNRELADADRRKDEFLAILAHELRNPMAPIVGAAHLLRLPDVSSAVATKALDALDRQAAHMVRLIDDLLDLSSITHGKVQLRRAPVTIAAIVSDAIAASAPLVADREHDLEVKLPREDITLLADGTRLSQVLTNLLNNAARYSPPRSKIVLEAVQDGEEAVFRVRDCGIGIEPHMLETMFGLFVQGDRKTERAQGGLGVGLTLAKRLVEHHGGTIVACSAGLGMGSELTVRLPIASEVADVGASSREPASTRGPARRVLVVEDNADISEMMKDMIEHWGHEAAIAQDGHAAVEAVLATRPDIAFIDIGLPGLDGYQVVEALRSRAPDLTTRLIALTGYGRPEDRARALAAGFDEHVVKPVTSMELSALIDGS